MNFKQAQFVVAVAKTNSFTKAAEACFITQPALSNAIHQLEDEIGGKLFSRTTRSVELTKLGELILDDMTTILETRERLLAKATDFLARDDNTVRIGLSPLLNNEYLELFMQQIKLLDKQIKIVVTEMNWTDIEHSLSNGIIDLGFGPKPLERKNSRSNVIYKEPLMFISENNKQQDQAIHIDQLRAETMLLVQDNCGLANTVRILLDENQVSVNEYEGRALGYHILERWVHLGLGVTLLPFSKVSNVSRARPITDNQGQQVPIIFKAFWHERFESKRCFNIIQQGISQCVLPQP